MRNISRRVALALPALALPALAGAQGASWKPGQQLRFVERLGPGEVEARAHVRINSREQSSVAILSSQDTNISHYHRVGEKKEICPTKLTIRGRLGVAQADLEWKMKYTEEKHASLPGTFLSSFGMDVFRAVGYEGEIREVDDPNGGFYQTGGTAFFNRQLIKSLSVNMEIKDLKNIGTEAAPRPGFTARVKVTPSFIFNSPWVRTCEVK